MEDSRLEPEHQEDPSTDPILIEFMSGLPEGFHLKLLQAYVDSPNQVTIENYLDVCRRTILGVETEQ